MESPFDLTTSLQKISPHALIEKKLIGQGGYGEVYLGEWQTIDVAIKKLYLKTLNLNEDLLQEFSREAEIMGRCQFPYIVRLYGVCMEPGNYALVMEYMPKGSLYQVLRDRNEPLPWNPIRWDIAIDIGRGLHYLHNKNILHLDMKSLNVLLDERYRAKISDFGLSKIKLESSSTNTKSKNVMGTTRWRAPESFKRGAKASKSTDIYSYGMVMWEISSRKLPYSEEKDEQTVISWIKEGEKEDIPADCPQAYGVIVQKCWLVADQRPTAEEVIEALRKAKPALDVKPIILPQPSPVSRPKPYLEKPWHFDPMTERKAALAENEQARKKYLLLEATDKDKQKVISFYDHHPVPGYEVGRVQVIYNRTFNVQFEAQMERLQERAGNPAFAPKWETTMSHLDFRRDTYRLFENITAPYKDPDYPAVKLVPTFRGTDVNILDSIFRAGYASLGTTDNGFFGQGYYSAYEAAYAYKYSKGALILNWVASFSALPVIYEDMSLLQGKGHYKNYDAHFVPVGNSSNPDEPSYYPCKPEDGHDYHQYTEIVVFESGACLPRYLVELQTVLPKSPLISLVQTNFNMYSPAPVSTQTPQKILKSKNTTSKKPGVFSFFESLFSKPQTLVQSHTTILPSLPVVDTSPPHKTLTPQSAISITLQPSQEIIKNENILLWEKILWGIVKDINEPVTIEEVQIMNLTPAQEEALKAWLFSFVEGSKTDKRLAQKASTAITTLNAMRVSFTGEYGDLSDVSIPGADLSYGVFSCTYFMNAHLRGVNFRGACLNEADFSGADLTNTSFGERAFLNGKGAVHSISYSRDGRYLAIAEGNNIGIFEKIQGEYERIQTLTGHTSDVRSVVHSPDGSQLASGSSDNTVRQWDVKSGKPLQTLTGHTHWVYSVAYSPNGSQLASGSGDTTVRQWDVKSGKAIQILTGHTDSVTCVTYSPDGSQLASGSGDMFGFGKDHTVHLWDVKSSKAIQTLTGHTSSIWSVAYSPDGSQLASGSWDKTVRQWDVKSGKALQTLTGHTSSVWSVAYSPDGSQLASGSSDNTVRQWDVKSGKALQTLTGHTSSVMSVAYSSDSSQLASGSSDKTVRQWDVKSGKPLQTLRGHTSSVWNVAYSPDGSQLASGSSDKTVRQWDVKSGKPLQTLTGHTSSVTCVAYSPDGSQLASGSWDKTVRQWDVKSAKAIQTLTRHTSFVTCVAYSPDGSQLASGSWDKTVRQWDVKSGKEIQTLRGHTDNNVTCVAYSPDGSQLASGSFKTVHQWDVKSAKVIHTFRRHAEPVICVAYSPDGSQLASGSCDNTVRQWDVKSGKEIQTLRGHTDTVTCVVYSPDGSLLASGSSDNTVYQWDVKSGKPLQTLTGHTDWVMSVAYSPDGNKLVSGSWDCSVIIWQKAESKVKVGHWVIQYRLSCSGALLSEGTYLQGAIISPSNLKLLKQRGANDTEKPDYQNNPHIFWARQNAQLKAKVNEEAPPITLKKDVSKYL